jgi:hypothetical protein
LIRFHGVLSAHASLRSEVIPSPPGSDDPASNEPEAQRCGAQLDLFPGAAACAGSAGAADNSQQREPSRKPWAWLLRHVYAADLSTCERCGGRMRWKELATTPDAIARLLARHGLSSGPDPPTRRRPRPPVPEQLELAFGS